MSNPRKSKDEDTVSEFGLQIKFLILIFEGCKEES
jgi:hypothetical protein